MFCMTSLVKSLKALIYTSANARPNALEVTKEIVTKYENVPPMSKTGRPIEQPIDVIKAEKEFGISFFTDFSHVLIRNGQMHLVLAARFQDCPHKTHFVACPQIICVRDLSEEDQRSLRYKLESIKERITEEDWGKLKERYGILQEQWLVISQ